MPLQSTSGAATYDAFGGGVAAVPNYIEDVFSTYLYTGNGGTQTITNGIDLDGEGGLVWIKNRADGTRHHELFDTARGVYKALYSNQSWAQGNDTNDLTAFNNNGFSIGSVPDINGSGNAIVSWTFRKQPKFFDVVTYTGNGSNRTISHNLGSVPGCIIVKSTSTTWSWQVYHSGLGTTGGYPDILRLDQTNAAISGSATVWSAAPTSTEFSIGTSSVVNQSGQTYVAYIFAHDAGGFGLTGLDNVISCGSFTTDGSGDATVSLGYEPQLVLMKYSSQSSDWMILDNMRGFRVTGNSSPGNSGLFPNLSNAESTSNGTISTYVDPNATGFTPIGFGPSKTVIYIAIRRGPMKVPTSGTEVFSPNIWTGTGSTQQITTGFFPDMFIGINRGAIHAKTFATDILRGLAVTLATNVTDAENSESGNTFNMTGYSNNNGNLNSGFGGGQTYVGHFFKRAPGFFDEVCYTGTGSATTFSHNLAAVPELMIVKRRDSAFAGRVYSKTIGNTKTLVLFSGSGNSEAITDTGVEWGATTPTSSVFSVGAAAATNGSGSTYVAYLFATCAGVSKVGSYTGNGSSQTINCGFTGGARFVLIKKTSGTGDWAVFDSARGIVSGNDPFLELNTTAAEQTGQDAVDTDSTGFIVNETTESLNASGGTYIFLAIA
jgi:hypothetical protein